MQALAQPMPDDKILALYEKGSYDVVPHDGMRKIIAQRLTLSKQTIPHFYLTVECRIDNLLRAREQVHPPPLRQRSVAMHGGGGLLPILRRGVGLDHQRVRAPAAQQSRIPDGL